MKKLLIATSTLLLITLLSLALYFSLLNSPTNTEPLNYSYSIANQYFHDPGAFTQGLVYKDGFLYESTGLFGASQLRKVELESGKVLENVSLASEYFGEGITLYENKIFQLTWLSVKGFVYDQNTFELLEEFSYRGEGWGITNDGIRLIMSNGSSTLVFLDPATSKILGEVQVTDGNVPVDNLNELEYVNGCVYANVWHQDKIAIINPQTGKIKGWIDLTGIYQEENADTENVLNGIAYDDQSDRLFVTGKRWSQLFEIKLELVM